MAALLWGYLDRTGRFAISPAFAQATPFVGGVARVRWLDDMRWGLVDQAGVPRPSPRYDHVKELRDGVAAVNVGGTADAPAEDPATCVVRKGRWGYCTAAGVELHPPTLDFALGFAEGLAGASLEGRCGWLDRDGRWAIERRFAFAGNFSEGLAVASDGKRDGLVGRDGAWVVEPAFDEALELVAGLARVRIGQAWRCVDRGGKPVSEDFDEIGPHADGLARVRRGEKWAVVDARGRLVGDAWFDEVLAPAGGVAVVRRGDRWSFLAPDGALHGSWVRALAHTEGVSRVSDGKAWGFANAAGQLVVPHRYDDLWAMNEGRAPALRGGAWTHVDREAQELGEPRWQAARPFAEGRAPVMQDGRWGFVGSTGELAIPADLDAVGCFAGDLCTALRAEKVARPSPPKPAVHVLPEAGLASSVFDGAGADDHLIALVGFSRELDEAELLRLDVRFQSWAWAIHRVKEGPIFTENRAFTSRTNLRVRLENARDPRAEIATLLGELEDAGLPIGETIFARWRMKPEGVMGPVPHPDAREGGSFFPDFEAYWRAVWDLGAPPPASESPMHLKGAHGGSDASIGALEERITPLWVPGLRICYGVGDFGDDSDPAGARVEEVGAAVTAAIATRFARVWKRPTAAPSASGWAKQPTAGWAKTPAKSPFGGGATGAPQPRQRDRAAGVERVEHDGRAGYAFAIDYGDLLHDASPERFRYREQELMEALGAAIATLGLAPVVLWQRFAKPLFGPLSTAKNLVVNLWETGP